MDKKERMDKKDTYVLVLIGLFYLYIYGNNVIGFAQDVEGWQWLPFIILSIVGLALCAFSCALSFLAVGKAIEYFGLPKNYLVLTILSIIIAPLTVVVLFLFLSGTIPSIFDPRFL